MKTLFISDLHLGKDYPQITTLFLAFLEHRARHADALYILGDLFEVWLGDDASACEYQAVIDMLRAVSDSGTDIAIMHGNRDFLIGADFIAASGARLIDDPTLITLNGQQTLLMHGDTLCTDDIEYQAFRRKVRDTRFQHEFLSLPASQRAATATHYRQMSITETRFKPSDIMDVSADAVVRTMHEHHVTRLIHGHTHRPALHRLDLDGQRAERIVLGDWYEKGHVLICDEQGCRPQNFDLDHL